MTMIKKHMQRETPPSLTDEQVARLQALEDREIDLSDIPEQLDWSHAVRGSLVRHRLAVDNDVFEWLQKDGKPAEVRLNELLHKLMEDES